MEEKDTISIKKLQTESGELGGQRYVNQNCWLAKSVNAPPAKRCWYCETRFQDCPLFRYLIVTLCLIIISLSIVLLAGGTISRSFVLSMFLFIVSYGYFFNKTTEELILANFSLRKARKILEESKLVLETRLGSLEKFRKITVGRELRMIELKKEIQRLKKELGEM
ncbi:hypothetical protein AMJ50_02720 [Parcubacteria bacterium DG_74_3]|nr:MAG: hypothetical protein AMJ50_02720 [Parcubacteria bacterium DG_74_3]